MNHEILLAGFGGQGILFAGKLLTYCGFIDKYEISWLPSYGPEMRGGTCNCSVCISDEPVGSPQVVEPSVLVVMNEPSFEKFVPTVQPGGKLILDSTLINCKCERTDINCFYIPATQIAAENEIADGPNLILTGKVMKEIGLFSEETIRKGLEKIIPPRKVHLIEPDMKAVLLGKSL